MEQPNRQAGTLHKSCAQLKRKSRSSVSSEDLSAYLSGITRIIRKLYLSYHVAVQSMQSMLRMAEFACWHGSSNIVFELRTLRRPMSSLLAALLRVTLTLNFGATVFVRRY